MGTERGLLPCPFCGGSAEAVSTRNGRSWVLCDNNKCFTQGPIHPRESAAVAAWNTRVAPKDHHND